MAGELLLNIALLLMGAKVFGYAFTKLGLSTLLGEIFAGILFGAFLGLVPANNGILAEVAGIGALFLLFLIGLSTKFEEFKDNLYASTVIALAGAMLSLVAGFFVGLTIFGDPQTALFVAVTLMATSTAISLRTVADSGKLQTSGGRMLVSVAIADDVIALLALSMLGTYVSVGQVDIWKAVSLFFGILGFFFILLTAGSKAVGHVLHVSQRVKDEQILVSVAVAVVFVIAFISERIGIAGVTAAFLVGMAMNRSPLVEKYVFPKAKVIGYGFFIPLFMAYSAVAFDIGSFFSSIWLIVLLGIVAALAKVIGCGVMSGFARLSRGEAKLIGVSMVPRGEYTIIIANILHVAGLITAHAYTIVLGVVIFTILIMPLISRLLSLGANSDMRPVRNFHYKGWGIRSALGR
ncbi:MAG: cation:proton antiporter [Candidatus Aenigmarchaeota archaeon]|nr:cation:proton antiporter [Candidatus Aenigmarchaeota archaeon]